MVAVRSTKKRAPRPHIPQTIGELDAAWFSDTLANGSGARVTTVDTVEIGAGIGFMGELHRCRLTWDLDDPALPRSVIAKIPTQVAANRAVGEGLAAYEREIDVYSRMSDRLGIPMPTHVHSAYDPDPAPWMSNAVLWLFENLSLPNVQRLIDRFLALAEKSDRRYLLLIEDIDDARPPSQVVGGTVDDAMAALEVLAGFHAANWGVDPDGVADAKLFPVNRAPRVFQAGYVRNRPAFVERFGHILGDEMIARMDRIQATLPARVDALVRPPVTISHGDYRLDNILFRPDGSLVVLDYQMMGIARPGWDVAYFITTALDPSHREAEGDMLAHYHRSLVAAGVRDHSYDELVADCDATKELLAHRMIGSGDALNTDIVGTDDNLLDLFVTRVIGWLDPKRRA